MEGRQLLFGLIILAGLVIADIFEIEALQVAEEALSPLQTSFFCMLWYVTVIPLYLGFWMTSRRCAVDKEGLVNHFKDSLANNHVPSTPMRLLLQSVPLFFLFSE